MNYELAKKLKDAGFPNSKDWFERYALFPIGYGIVFRDENDNIVPTLSELIEACGENFTSLNHGASHWEASGVQVGNNEPIWVRGSTPEEAVANLWLTLNEKKQ